MGIAIRDLTYISTTRHVENSNESNNIEEHWKEDNECKKLKGSPFVHIQQNYSV